MLLASEDPNPSAAEHRQALLDFCLPLEGKRRFHNLWRRVAIEVAIPASRSLEPNQSSAMRWQHRGLKHNLAFGKQESWKVSPCYTKFETISRSFQTSPRRNSVFAPLRHSQTVTGANQCCCMLSRMRPRPRKKCLQNTRNILWRLCLPD